MPRSTPANKIDRDMLHAYLYRHSNNRGRITVKHIDLAEDLGIRDDHLGRIMNEMAAAGRVKRITSSNNGVVYSVRDPTEWEKEHPRRGRRR